MKLHHYLSLFSLLPVLATGCKSPDQNKTEAIIESGTLKVEVLTQDLEVPWGLDFLPNGDLIFTERPGKISILPKGLNEPVVIHERDVLDRAEGGLLGLAVSPNFEENGYVLSLIHI